MGPIKNFKTVLATLLAGLSIASFPQANATDRNEVHTLLSETARVKISLDSKKNQLKLAKDRLWAEENDPTQSNGNETRIELEQIRWNIIQLEREIRKLEKDYARTHTPLRQAVHENPSALAPLYLEPSLPVLSVQSLAGLKGSTATTGSLGSETQAPLKVGLVHKAAIRHSAPAFFLNSDQSILSPVSPLDSVKFLFDPIEGFQAKIEALTGTRLPEHVYRDYSADFQLDFSRAPKLDEIYLYSLFIRNDFSGNLMAQALKYHADRGTQIRILVSEAINRANKILSPEETEKDILFLQYLDQMSPNIQVQRYLFDRKFLDRVYTFGELHRVSHTKILLTLSRSNPDANRAVIGGRNISDAYVFETPPDLSRFPRLIKYSSAAYWPVTDLEVVIKGRRFTQDVAPHLLAFWKREPKTMHYEDPWAYLDLPEAAAASAPALNQRLQTTPHARHFLSSPFGSDNGFTRLFVDMVRSARHSVRLVTPYLNPNKEIRNALIEASERGVEVEIVTNLDLKGDDYAAETIRSINRTAALKFIEKARIYTWDHPRTMLHMKTLLIDDKVLYVGAANLNRRSFTEDIENGVLLTGESTIRDYQKIRQEVLRQSVPVSKIEEAPFLQKVIMSLFGFVF